ALGDYLRLFLGKLKALLVGAFFIADEFEEERNVVCAAFVAETLNPRMFFVVDVLGIERRVIKQDLDAVSAGFFQTPHGPMVEQIAKAAGPGFVISSLLVREQQASVLGAPLGRG